MILIDYTQFCIANIFSFQKDLVKGASSPEAINIIRHAVLSGIKMYKKHHRSTYGSVVLACDGQDYWRRSVFPYYKAHRKAARDKSNLDWELIFDTISQLREEIKTNFPYIVVHVDRAEADDIIATLCEHTQDHLTIDNGIVEDKQPVLILSSDGDFKQLHKYDNVKQWSMAQKKWVKSVNCHDELVSKICCGDTGDGIPNIMSADNVFITEGVRQTPFRKKRLDTFIQDGKEACQNDNERRNWDRNMTLISFDHIPQDVKQSILDEFYHQMSLPRPDKMAIYNYLVKNKCRLLLNEIEDF